MPVPSTRTPVRIARGTYAAISTTNALAALLEGEMVYATDQDLLYCMKGGALVAQSYAALDSPGLTGTPTSITPTSGDNSTKIATTAFVVTEIADLVDSAPASLDTLSELATALGQDENFSTTVTNSISLKAPIDGPSFTGSATFASSITATSASFTSSTTNTWLNANTSLSSVDYAWAAKNASTNNWVSGLTKDATLKLGLEVTASPKITLTGSTGAATFAGSITDSKGDVRKIPPNAQAGIYTLVAADAGKYIFARNTVTIPDSVFSAGDVVTIVNNTEGDIILTKSVTTMYNASDGTSDNRTIAARGMATILFTSGTVAYISGAGLS